MSAGRARNARINQAIRHATKLLNNLNNLANHKAAINVDQKDDWQDGRNYLEQLTQCFHEANAYNNIIGK